jgi:hypothetical protein
VLCRSNTQTDVIVNTAVLFAFGKRVLFVSDAGGAEAIV